jgi:hypothetical protein
MVTMQDVAGRTIRRAVLAPGELTSQRRASQDPELLVLVGAALWPDSRRAVAVRLLLAC